MDEYQDTNRAQYRLLKLLAGVRGLHRGGRRRSGDLRLARRRRREPAPAAGGFSKPKVIKLEQNYRSTTRILHAANTVIANNEKLFGQKAVVRARRRRAGDGGGLPDAGTRSRIGGDEDLRPQVRAPHPLPRITPSSIRGNHQARSSSSNCATRRSLRHLRRTQLLRERRDQDLCAYLRLIANEDDDLAFIRPSPCRARHRPATIETLGATPATAISACFAAVFEEGVPNVAARQLDGARVLPFHQPHGPPRPAEPPGRSSTTYSRPSATKPGCCESCEPPRSRETKWSNVGDFTGWLAEGRGGRSRRCRT